MNMRTFARAALALMLSISVTAAFTLSAQAEPVKVFAAASLKNAIDAVSKAWTAADASKSTAPVYAASSALAKQIEQDAPADVFMSADLDWMDYLATKNLVKADTRKSLLGNNLVLVGLKGAGLSIELKQGADLAALIGDSKLAVANIEAVPAGKYAKAALTKLGMFAAVEPKLAQAENVRSALAFVATGEAKLGIVYGTDAKAEKKVDVVATFPDDSHVPIVYPVAVVASSKNADAMEFLTFLSSPEATKIFAEQGFQILK